MYTLLVYTSFFSQNQNKKWYFGITAGLDFVTNAPTPISTSAMSSTGFNEGTASIADAFGNLLFYTNGVTVWNKVNQVMANGTALFGNYLASQSLIVKQPGNSNIYFVFTLPAINQPGIGLCYSIVDMNLAAGMGSVTVKNIPIGPASTEKLTGTRHCNGIDTWVVSHDYNTNVFRSLLVTSSGVSSTATLSAIGNTINSVYQSFGSAKISPNGKKFGWSVYHNTAGFGNFEIYNFDNSNGMLSSQLSLTIAVPPDVFPKYPWGCEFSPDGSKFYGTAIDSVIYQWDLCAGSNTAINNSRRIISCWSAVGIQLATDGKIYVVTPATNLGVINKPNLTAPACNYIDQSLSVAPGTTSWSLPNFISGINLVPFSYSTNTSVNCNAASFMAPPPPTVTTTACTSMGYNITSFVWYFGDPASGSANTSTLSNPVHTYPGQGTYTASLVYTYNNSCGGINTDTLKQEVKIGVLPLVSSAGFNLCSGSSLTLSAPAAQTYSWNTGSFSNSISVNPSVTSTYTVSGIDINGCLYKSVQTIDVYNTPTLSIKGATTVCPGFQVKLTASGANTYSWSTGQTYATNYNVQNANTTYTVYGSANGCIGQQTITVLLKGPDIMVSGNTTVCPGTAVTLTAGGAVDYLWNGGITGSSVVVTPTSTTVYTVQGMDAKSCTNTNSVLITIQTQTPATDFYYKSPVCPGNNNLPTFTVSGFNGGGIFSSSDLQVNPGNGEVHIASATSGTYFVNYSLAANGCTAAAQNSATLEILPGPVLNITHATTITPGATVALQVSGGTSYTWDPISFLSCTDCSAPIATPPENIKYCVSSQMNSCTGSTCVSIVVTCETNSDNSIPNAFTPNGDGTNDQFCLQGWNSCVKEFNIIIFDVWGELVFESSDPGFCWDGVYKGSQLGTGVFVYVVKARRPDNIAFSKKGNISLIR